MGLVKVSYGYLNRWLLIFSELWLVKITFTEVFTLLFMISYGYGYTVNNSYYVTVLLIATINGSVYYSWVLTSSNNDL